MKLKLDYGTTGLVAEFPDDATVIEPVYVPPGGLNVGVATVPVPGLMVYVAVPMSELAIPVAVAIALMVRLVVTLIGPVYCGDDVVGVLPSWV